MKLNILCIGDVVGKPGRRVLAEQLKQIVDEHSIDCVIVNAENAAGGSGLTPQIYTKLQRYGVNLITLGDHTYRKRDIIKVLETADDIVRPANMCELSAGKGSAIYQTFKGPKIAILSVIGRTFMKPADCPFAAVDKMIPRLKQSADLIFVEVHAEATSEKIAMGHYLDGKVTCCFGTHTHVQTADEKILPLGTAYITDIGMTGPHDSVLGRDKENVLKSFRTQMPYPFQIAKSDIQINGIIVTADSNTAHAESITRITVKSNISDDDTYDSDDGRNENLSNGFMC